MELKEIRSKSMFSSWSTNNHGGAFEKHASTLEEKDPILGESK